MKRTLTLLSVIIVTLAATGCGNWGGGKNITGGQTDTNPNDFFSLSVTPASFNVNVGGGGRGGNQGVEITLIPVGDYNGNVTLLAPTGLPTGVTAAYVIGGNTCNLTIATPCNLDFLADTTATVGKTSTVTIPADGYRLAGTSTSATFTVQASLNSTATILYINPNAGVVNSNVTVYGSGFGTTQGTLNFTLQKPMTTTILSWSDNVITAVVPAAAKTGAVTVTVNGTQSNTVNFTVGTPASTFTLGAWSTLSTQMPFTSTTNPTSGLPIMNGLNPIHMALLHTNQILMVGGSQNCPPVTVGCPAQDTYPLGAGIYDLSHQTITPIAPTTGLTWDMFCNGMSIMQDGRVLMSGGTKAYGQLAPVGQGGGLLPFLGLPNSAIFDPSRGEFSVNTPTAAGRWYPTVTELGNGQMMSTSGLSDTYGTAQNPDNTNNTSEIWNGAAWSSPIPLASTYPQSTQQMTFFLYPRLHLLPTGHVFMSEPDAATMDFDPTTDKWSFVTWTLYPCYGTETNCSNGVVGDRTYGTSVLLPMTPANGYDPTVMIMGGDNPATYTTELIDFNPNGNFFNNPPLGTAAPCTYSAFCFVEGPRMIQPRVEMEGTILPNGQVLVDSGSAEDEQVGTASLDAELYTPANPAGVGTFTEVAPNQFDRYYHNTQLLLPTGEVLLAGSNPRQGNFEARMELFKPPYLFAADGTPAPRPQIVSAPKSLTYGTTFLITTANTANDITAVALLKAGSVTHSFDMDQRYVGLAFTSANGALTVNTSAINSNIAPPGFYMLYIVNAAGVPSLSQWIQVGGATAPVANVELHSEKATTPGWVLKRYQVTEAPLAKHAHMMVQSKEAAPAPVQ